MGRTPSYYHASTAILIANHGDFFNTHAISRQLNLKLLIPARTSS